MKMLLKDGKKKVLTLSYDDGVVQDKKLVDILNKNGIKCTFNINTGLFCNVSDAPTLRRMSKEAAIKLFKGSSHEVAIHGYTHLSLEGLDATKITYEILEDRKNIEKNFGIITRGMAYPYGAYDEKVIDVLKKCNIAYSRVCWSSYNFEFPKDWLIFQPTCHHNDNNLMVLAKKFVEDNNRAEDPRMFCLWGHSYEFDERNNWSVIEEFAEYMGGRDEIWYATNIDVYDYVEAYKRLHISCENNMVCNPSTIDVWTEIEGTVHCIKAGETVCCNGSK